MASKKTKENKAKTPKADKAATERNAAAAEKAKRDNTAGLPQTPANARSVQLGTKQTRAEKDAAAAQAYGEGTKEQHRAGGLHYPDSFYEPPVEHGKVDRSSKEK